MCRWSPDSKGCFTTPGLKWISTRNRAGSSGAWVRGKKARRQGEWGVGGATHTQVAGRITLHNGVKSACKK